MIPDRTLDTLCNFRVGRAPDKTIGRCWFSSVGYLLRVSTVTVMEITKKGLIYMLSLTDSEIRTLGYEMVEVQQRFDALEGKSCIRTRSKTGKYTSWGCDMDMTAIAGQLQCLVVVVSTECMTAYPPCTGSMSLCKFLLSSPSILNKKLPCVILAHLGGCHFEPTVHKDAKKGQINSLSHFPSFDHLLKVSELKTPAPSRLPTKRKRKRSVSPGSETDPICF